MNLQKLLDPFTGLGLSFEPRPVALALVDAVIMETANEQHWPDHIQVHDYVASCADDLVSLVMLQSDLCVALKWAVRRGHLLVDDPDWKEKLDSADLGTGPETRMGSWLRSLYLEAMHDAFIIDQRVAIQHAPMWGSILPPVSDSRYARNLAGLCVQPAPNGDGYLCVSPLPVVLCIADLVAANFVDGSTRAAETYFLTYRVPELLFEIDRRVAWLIARGHCCLSAPWIKIPDRGNVLRCDNVRQLWAAAVATRDDATLDDNVFRVPGAPPLTPDQINLDDEVEM